MVKQTLNQNLEEKTLLTDLYQLTMNASYLDNQKDEIATFDLFIRKLPKDWGYFIANGIEDALDYATSLKFSQEDISYLREQNLFNEEFLDSLKNFKFEGDIYSVKEGTPITANTPILRVTAKRTQAQFLETTLLNLVNFQTMIASKASRIVNAANRAANKADVSEFGLRRAQDEDAAIKGTRACYIAGCKSTSNVKAGKEYNIPIKGTHAHSFVMSFPSEIEAFRAYTNTFPNNATLLIDTYYTVQGARNAVIIGKELEKKGNKLGAVRLDSGDLTELSKEVRKILDENNLPYVRIVASNDLNEYTIDDLTRNNAPICIYGVGTEMITAKPVAAISGVYKIVEDSDGAKIKLSPGKKTYPGKKQVYRISDDQGRYLYDILALEDEQIEGIEGIKCKPLLEKVVENGHRLYERRSLDEIRQYSLDCVSRLPSYLKEVQVNSPYELKISEGLQGLVDNLTKRYNGHKETNGGLK